VNYASEGDLILVAPGVYTTGGVAVAGTLTSRVAITKGVTVRSIEGPDATIIVGAGPVGDAAIRCVYVASNAVLDGFTLQQGHTRSSGDAVTERSGGGAWCEEGGVLDGVVVSGCRADASGGGVYGGSITNAFISGNAATNGGGVAGATVSASSLVGNSAATGGGAFDSILYGCSVRANEAQTLGGGLGNAAAYGTVVTGNTAQVGGGGADASQLWDSEISGNSAPSGGGATDSTLWNIRLHGNAADDGAGARGGSLFNCVIVSNRAAATGGGLQDAEAYNCTVVANHAATDGGGAHGGTLVNCIVVSNTAGNAAYRNYRDGTFWYSCAQPLPAGVANLDADPLFVGYAAGNVRLLPGSPCIDAGTNLPWMAFATDFAGHPRVAGGRVDIGPTRRCPSTTSAPAARMPCRPTTRGRRRRRPSRMRWTRRRTARRCWWTTASTPRAGAPRAGP
jgi:hypothetical protein